MTPLARRDLHEITAWYLERSGFPEVAENWADGFFEVINDLATSADRHPEANEIASLTGDVREVHYGSGRRRTHRIVFEIIDNDVVVLRIRHSAQKDLTADDLRDDSP